jgi:glycosyltransferase involved in cell wall biosynthesis
MNICFFTSANSLQGGAELSQARIVRHLLREGHTAHVVLPFESDLAEHYRRLGAAVHILYWQHLQTLRAPLHVLRYLLWLPVITARLARLLRRRRVDLLHVNEILDFQGLVAARLARTPCLTYVRIILPSALPRRVLAWLALRLADRVVCVSQAVHRLALGGTDSPKVRVIYNGGPDPAVFDPRTVQPIRPSGCEGKPLIGLAAKLVSDKGHLALLELAQRLDRRGFTDVHYEIVGGPVPGHERYAARLREAISRAGLAGRFHLVGRQHDIPAWMAGMDIVCHLPLCQDCFPAAPMEAAAMEKPVLTFVSGGIPEQLTHPGSARMVPIGDVAALADHAAQLLADPRLRLAMGQAARREVLSKFSIPRHLGQIEGVYRELLDSRADRRR